jgi:hypothetical protein
MSIESRTNAFQIRTGEFPEDQLSVFVTARQNGSLGPILPDYPLLSRLDDISDDAVYERGEVDALLAEYLRAQNAVKNPRALRGVDKLIRVARWAQKLGVGIYFSGQ